MSLFANRISNLSRKPKFLAILGISQPAVREDRMIGNIVKNRTTEEKSPVGVCRQNAKILDFRRISVF
jgi:hypothetical protein